MATVVVHNKAGERLGEITSGETFDRFRREQAKQHGAEVAVGVRSGDETHLLTSPRELKFLAGEHNGELLLKVALPRKRAGAEAWKVS